RRASEGDRLSHAPDGTKAVDGRGMEQPLGFLHVCVEDGSEVGGGAGDDTKDVARRRLPLERLRQALLEVADLRGLRPTHRPLLACHRATTVEALEDRAR